MITCTVVPVEVRPGIIIPRTRLSQLAPLPPRAPVTVQFSKTQYDIVGEAAIAQNSAAVSVAVGIISVKSNGRQGAGVDRGTTTNRLLPRRKRLPRGCPVTSKECHAKYCCQSASAVSAFWASRITVPDGKTDYLAGTALAAVKLKSPVRGAGVARQNSKAGNTTAVDYCCIDDSPARVIRINRAYDCNSFATEIEVYIARSRYIPPAATTTVSPLWVGINACLYCLIRPRRNCNSFRRSHCLNQHKQRHAENKLTFHHHPHIIHISYYCSWIKPFITGPLWLLPIPLAAHTGPAIIESPHSW